MNNYLLFLSIGFLLVGIWMYLKPPKRINYFYGYRTNKSMSSQEAWDFAQVYSGKMFIVTSLVMMAISFVLILDIFSSIAGIMALVVPLIGCMYAIVRTELELKRRYFRKKV